MDKNNLGEGLGSAHLRGLLALSGRLHRASNPCGTPPEVRDSRLSLGSNLHPQYFLHDINCGIVSGGGHVGNSTLAESPPSDAIGLMSKRFDVEHSTSAPNIVQVPRTSNLLTVVVLIDLLLAPSMRIGPPR